MQHVGQAAPPEPFFHRIFAAPYVISNYICYNHNTRFAAARQYYHAIFWIFAASTASGCTR